MSVACPDERIAVAQAHGRKYRVAECLRTMPSPGLLPEQGHFVFPNDTPCWIILADTAITLLGNQIIAMGDLSDQTRITVRIGMVHLQFDLLFHGSGLVDFNNPCRT